MSLKPGPGDSRARAARDRSDIMKFTSRTQGAGASMTSAAERGTGTGSREQSRPDGVPVQQGGQDSETEERIAPFGPETFEVPPPGPEGPDRLIDEAELDRICLHNLLSACADMIFFK